MRVPSLVVCLLICCFSVTATASEKQYEFFENKIRPLLVEHCYECHSTETDTSEGGLFLDHQMGWKEGGDSGPALVPGDPDNSLLMEAVSYENVDLQMPPEAKLSSEQVELLRTWIQQGAPDPRSDDSVAKKSDDEFNLEKRKQEHWCWQPLAAATPPTVDSPWPQDDIDRFVLAKLQEHDLSPAAPADKRTWLRRATLTITGLPPTTEEIRAFLEDSSEDAKERVVERLVNSPHFGELWGQHWLDLMRFAETRGHEQDFAIPHAFRFRDYVIRALNADVPYDQFVMEHVAGDLLPNPRLDAMDRSNQSIQGTGFWQLHDATHSPVDIRGDEALRFQNQIDVFSRTFLGLSLGCARCHDHKFDAISTRDYYSMYGFLQSSSYYVADVSDPVQQAEVTGRLEALNEEYTNAVRPLLSEKIIGQASALNVYLKAALEVGEDHIQSESLPAAIATEAEKQKLDAEALWNLAKHLHQELPIDAPLKSWSLQAKEKLTKEQAEAKVARKRQEARRRNEKAWNDLVVTRSEKDGERNYRPVDRPFSDKEIIEDFSSSEFPHWITAGKRFSDRPLAVGEILPGATADRPVRWFADVSCAASETLSSKLTGMLRTRTFEVTGDTVWYRYRGQGNVFLAVDSHRVVAGPLHGVVKRQLKAEGSGWKWASQRVREYVGHRIHVEFTGGPDFAVDKVLFAGSKPPEESLPVFSVPLSEQLASVADRLTKDQLTGADAAILNWWLEHQELFPSVDDPRLSKLVSGYTSKKATIERDLPKPIHALTLLDGNGENEPVHIRGNHRNRSADFVPRNVLRAMGEIDAGEGQGSGRLALAKKLTSPDNPLLARVYVNRVWHHIFGRGIVETVDDFGVMGKEPSHPELLDFLALEFMSEGWSTKRLIRRLMLTSTYAMSSHAIPENENSDPTNRYWHKMPVRRLTGEVIRDQLLAVSGRLDRKLHGPSVKVHITPFMRGNRTPKGSGPLDGDGRRSIYTEVRRNHLPAFLAAFDKPPRLWRLVVARFPIPRRNL